MSEDSVNSGRKTGRPRKGEPPRIPYDELDRLLVFGEVVTCEDGESTTVVYPSYRDLARRYGVSNSLIAQYSKQHNCLRRREVAQERIKAKADQKLVEMRATAIALSKEDTLRMIDSFLLGFEKALSEGRVRYDNPTDFNTMVRLKEFILGGADSRQEIHAALSLEDIQARHQRMLRTIQSSSAKERGGLALPPSRNAPRESNRIIKETDRRSVSNSPTPPAEVGPGEVTGRLLRPADPLDGPLEAANPHGRVSRAGLAAPDDGARGPVNAPHGANVGACGPTSRPLPAREGQADAQLGLGAELGAERQGEDEAPPTERVPFAAEPAGRRKEKVCEESGRVCPPVAEPVLDENRSGGKPRGSAEFRRRGEREHDLSGPSVSGESVLPREPVESLAEHGRAQDEHEESME